MDGPTASVIVAIIGAAATITATLITTRSKMQENAAQPALLPKRKRSETQTSPETTDKIPPAPADRSSASIFRRFGLLLLCVLYMVNRLLCYYINRGDF